MSYKPYYTNGWQSGEAGGTPITPEALNHMEEGIEAAGAHADSTSNPHEVTAAQVGAAAASHGNHVPATQTANNATFLRNDNTWQTVTPANIGAAASSHNHSASNITSGTLSSDRLPTVPITKGGLGGTDRLASAKNLTNEAVSSPGYVVSLTSNWAKFGYTTLQQLRNASGLGNTTGALPVANGGTGSSGTSVSSASSGAHYAHFAKFGNLVVCTLIPKANRTEPMYSTSFTVPSGYRPKSAVSFSIYSNINKTAGGPGVATLSVATGGSLTISQAYGIGIWEAAGTYCWISA